MQSQQNEHDDTPSLIRNYEASRRRRENITLGIYFVLWGSVCAVAGFLIGMLAVWNEMAAK